jgi:hypothetical protein
MKKGKDDEGRSEIRTVGMEPWAVDNKALR